MTDHVTAVRQPTRMSPAMAGHLASRLSSRSRSGTARRAVSPVPGFTVAGMLGRGAAAVVYDATHDASGARVALKVIDANAGDRRVRRAQREIGLLQTVSLRCVPCLVEYGQHEGSVYIALEYVPGRRIDAFVSSEALTTAERASLLAEVADAVEAIHEQGVVHRDLKPANILVDASGRPVLIDLGLAAQLDMPAEESLSGEGTPIGSPAFMAPEQARGERGNIGRPADIFALGALGYRLLTGEPPQAADASAAESIRLAANEEPRDPRAIEPSLDPVLAAILRRACRRSIDERYHSARALARDLRSWVRASRIAEPASDVMAARPATDQSVWRMAISALIAVACTLAIVGGVMVLNGPRETTAAPLGWTETRDVFPEVAGEEVVVVTEDRGTGELMVRVYSRDGSLLMGPNEYSGDRPAP